MVSGLGVRGGEGLTKRGRGPRNAASRRGARCDIGTSIPNQCDLSPWGAVPANPPSLQPPAAEPPRPGRYAGCGVGPPPLFGSSAPAGAALILIGAIIFLIGLIIQKAMGGIFGVALYHYAAEGEAMGGFTAAELDSAVKPKSGSGPTPQPA